MSSIDLKHAYAWACGLAAIAVTILMMNFMSAVVWTEQVTNGGSSLLGDTTAIKSYAPTVLVLSTTVTGVMTWLLGAALLITVISSAAMKKTVATFAPLIAYLIVSYAITDGPLTPAWMTYPLIASMVVSVAWTTYARKHTIAIAKSAPDYPPVENEDRANTSAIKSV